MSATNYQLNPNLLANKPMPEEWYKKAIGLFKIPSTSYNETSMALYIAERIKNIPVKEWKIDDYGNIIIVKGKALTYPCFCAHLDTVHTYPNGFKLIHYRKNEAEIYRYLYAIDNDTKMVGIGGDDKCGVFACLYLLERLEQVKIIFFSQEESGGIGSSNIELSEFNDCQFLGGIDRWNGHDFINRYSGSHTISKAFKKALRPLLKKYGYEFTTGLFTDAFNVIDRDIELSCFNVSCGYYSHHSDNEYVDLNELYNACLLCEEIAKLNETYLHHYTGWKNYKNYKSWEYNKDYLDKPRVIYSSDSANLITKSTCEKDEAGHVHRFSSPKLNGMSEMVRYCENCGLELLDYERGRYCTPCNQYFAYNY